VIQRPSPALRLSLNRHLLTGATLVAVLVFGLGGWAATTELSGAVIAAGQLVVDTNIKKVQHPTGGIITELRVKEGDHVVAGEIVARLDQTQIKANLGIISSSLDELTARQSRHEAERDGSDSVNFPDDLLARSGDPAVARVQAGESRLFELRKASREGQKRQLEEQISQLRERITGLDFQTVSKHKEVVLIQRELVGVMALWEKNLVRTDRLTGLQREATRTEGEVGQLAASVAEAKEKIAETELQVLQVDRDAQAEVARDLGDIRAKISELKERRGAVEDQLRRVDIRSPQTGIVNQLSVHTVGGVIGPQGEPLMLIVPDADELRVEARVQPSDIDQVRVGQTAALHFTALNARSTPQIEGITVLIAADITQDARSGAPFYVVRIAMRPDQLARLGPTRLLPGMPVEAFIETTPRTVISYLTRPVRDQIGRAFRDK
jgi:HlyD family secretion protein